MLFYWFPLTFTRPYQRTPHQHQVPQYAACHMPHGRFTKAMRTPIHTVTPPHRMAHSFTKKRQNCCTKKRQRYCSGTPAVNIFVHILALLLCSCVCMGMHVAAQLVLSANAPVCRAPACCMVFLLLTALLFDMLNP